MFIEPFNIFLGVSRFFLLANLFYVFARYYLKLFIKAFTEVRSRDKTCFVYDMFYGIITFFKGPYALTFIRVHKITFLLFTSPRSLLLTPMSFWLCNCPKTITQINKMYYPLHIVLLRFYNKASFSFTVRSIPKNLWKFITSSIGNFCFPNFSQLF